MKRLLTVIVLTGLGQLVFAQPPEAPSGKVWVLLEEMSDEFGPGGVDEDKWQIYDRDRSWNRTAAFDRRVLEVIPGEGKENYVLSMNPMWYEEEERFSKYGRTYEFAGGGMATEAMLTYGYIEVRIRPSDFPFGSGVFMNSRRRTDGPCGASYATELDIIENMGYMGPGSSNLKEDGLNWNNKMHVNTHAKPTDGNCRGLPYISTGGNLHKDLEDPLGFSIVGAWWKDQYSADYFLNGEYFQTIEFPREFYIPMPVILTMETYTWGSDENNADNPKPEQYMFRDDFRTKDQRAVLYDWVRVWKLIDERDLLPAHITVDEMY